MGYIKQITIQGFKSYKDQMQIEPFSPNCNVIVGRNGSGKSNFFAAVRFVLGDDYNFLNRQERQALLHEGSGSAVMSAYVEVCFDNTEDRFQTGKPEFFLRRTIGAKKDEYSVNRKNATKSEVIQILESAGFSRSNPYYIVPQGRVTALTNMKDRARLEMLKEISGSNVYETRRADSLKLLHDTDSKCANIDSVVASINERLAELEDEKEELEAWSKNDRERRGLLYTLHSREEAELEAKIDHVDTLEHHGREMREDNEATFRQNEDDIARLESEINQRQGELDILRQDRIQYEGERKAATLEKARIELDLKALQDSQSSAQQTRNRRDGQVKALQRQLNTRQAELEQLLPQFEAKKEEEEAVRTQLLDAEGQYKRLQDKQGRTAHFNNKRERDTALRAQIDETNGDLSRRKAVLMQTNEEIAELQNQVAQIESEIAELRQAIDNEGSAAVDLAAQLEKAKDAKRAIVDKQTNFWREQNRLSSQLGNVQKDLQVAEHTLSRLLDHGTSRGLESLRRYRRDGLQGVHGTIAELLQVPENYRSVTESAAEAALFHVVVEDDNVASKIMDRLVKDKGGRLTFIPLNRISVPDIQLRPTENMQPLLPKLGYDDRFEAAFRHVFGKVVVCPTLDECKRFAKQYNVRAYNPDGDNATRKGQYRGGYHDPSRSKIRAFSVVAEKRAQLEELQQKNRDIEEQLESIRHQLTAAQSELLRRQNDQRRGETSYAPMREEIRVKQSLLQDIRDTLEKKQRTAADLEAAISLLGAQQSDWEAEIASKFTKALSNDEEQMLVTLTSTVKDLRRQSAQLRQERAALETQKIEADLEINQSLQPALDDLFAQQGGQGGSAAQSSGLREAKRALDATNKSIANLDQQIEETDNQIDEIRAQIEQLETSRNEKEQSNRALAAAMEKQEKSLSRKDADRSSYTAQLARIRKEIRDLGTLPEDVDRKYSKWNTEKIGRELTKATQAQKQFAHVNKKAYEQYENFTRQRKTLTDRRRELDHSRKSIENLIAVLDHRKDEAIARTFKQVSKAFKDVFQELVPIGTGRLIINRRSDGAQSDEDDDSEDEAATQPAKKKGSRAEEYSSVSIAVSFNSKHDEQQKIGQLSGGQKSLCALALIFAIQQCDPAPFYLFDEIDANLDAQYRTAVANMLQKLSGQGGLDRNGGGQFICTTFRPEMVLVADRCYGVTYTNKTSSIDVVDREDALGFVEGMQK